LEEPTLESENRTASDAAGRIPCPFCGKPVALPVEAVLDQRPIPCLSCGAEMSVDADSSREALSLLERWRADSETVRQFAEPPGFDDPPRKIRRGKRPPRR